MAPTRLRPPKSRTNTDAWGFAEFIITKLDKMIIIKRISSIFKRLMMIYGSALAAAPVGGLNRPLSVLFTRVVGDRFQIGALSLDLSFAVSFKERRPRH
jgi:hypothetical protein